MRIGTRLSYNGHLCTLRYIGPLDAWPGFTVYGVEWDDPSRGKHSGEYDGKRLFECRIEGAGSFLKSTKLRDEAKSFVDIVNELYANGEKLTNAAGRDLISIGSKVLEKVGFDKNLDLNRLESISVSQRRVTDIISLYVLPSDDKINPTLAEALDQDRKKIQEFGFSSLKSLDLGYSLISNFSYVTHLVEIFQPTLNNIILNGNRFDFSPLPSQGWKSWDNISHLSFSATLVTNEDLQKLGLMFPKLATLNLSMNRFQEEEVIDFSNFKCLEMLDLSYNGLTSTKLSQVKLPGSLRKLNLSNNHISDNLFLHTSVMDNLFDLDVSYNLISDWKFVESLGYTSSRLQNLRINNNPIYAQALAEQSTASPSSVGMWDEVSFGDIYVMARWSSDALERLNGRTITSMDKQDAELYFISKVISNVVKTSDFDPFNSKRWKQLVAKHDVQSGNQNDTKTSETIGSKLVNIIVNYDIEVHTHEDYRISIKKKVLKNTSIQKIKGMICKSINSEISKENNRGREQQTEDHLKKIISMVSPLNVELWINNKLRIDDEGRFLDFYGIKDGDRLILRNSTV